jgi:vancomycin resistance protein YoaR
MTTLDDVLIPPVDAGATRSRRLWPRVLAAIVVGFVLTLAVAAGALLAYDSGYNGRILRGVDVGGVDLSGLDSAQASATLASALGHYGDGRVVIRTNDGEVVVPYRAFSRRPDTGALVDAAMQTGRSGTLLERAVAEVRLAISGTSLEPRVTLDAAALSAAVDVAVAPLDRRPLDSLVVMIKGSIHAFPAAAGQTFDTAAIAAAALERVGMVDAPDDVVIDAQPAAIPPNHGDVEAQMAQTTAERMIGDIVVKLGKKQWKIKASTVRTWVGFETGADGVARPTLDESAIPGALKAVAKAVRVAPVSAAYLKSSAGKVVGVAPSQSGQRLDTSGTAAAIATALARRTVVGAPVTVKVKLAAVAPKLTTEQAGAKGPVMSMLGSWKTWFPISDHNFFGANIWQPAKIIDGMVLKPGQRFEWWSAIGPVSPARGFGPGGFIAGDHTEPTGALGGGMCSSSTTLFNAALRAGLEIDARSNHKYYIYRYPLGLDATVSKTPGGGSQTMSFTNDMRTPIVIRTYRYRAAGRGWVRYEIWGIPDGRKVSLSNPTVANVQKAITRTEYVSTLRRGVRMQTEFPANGMDVSVTRTVRDRNGAVMHQETYGTHYVLWNGIIQIGR